MVTTAHSPLLPARRVVWVFPFCRHRCRHGQVWKRPNNVQSMFLTRVHLPSMLPTLVTMAIVLVAHAARQTPRPSAPTMLVMPVMLMTTGGVVILIRLVAAWMLTKTT